MQDERSASDAEMYRAGFRTLGLGKAIEVATPGAVIGTGSCTLLDGSALRTPGISVWTGTPRIWSTLASRRPAHRHDADGFREGRDAQIGKAVEVLKQEMAKRGALRQP
jgi:hypothetical protein